jgi:hypothetical protein
MEKIKLFIDAHPELPGLAHILSITESLDILKKQKFIDALTGMITYSDSLEHRHNSIGNEMLDEYIEDLKERKDHYMSELVDITGMDIEKGDVSFKDILEYAMKKGTYQTAAHVIDHVIDIKDIKTKIELANIIKNK